jgi:hypothetical protein
MQSSTTRDFGSVELIPRLRSVNLARWTRRVDLVKGKQLKMVSFILLFPSLVCLGGCYAQPKPIISPTPKQYTSYLAAVNERPAFQRFVLVNRTSERGDDARGLGAYALDTVTGQLCRTYPLEDPKAQLLPLCRDLWMNTTKDHPLGLFDETNKK